MMRQGLTNSFENLMGKGVVRRTSAEDKPQCAIFSRDGRVDNGDGAICPGEMELRKLFRGIR